jgi:hypothetical protein
VAPGPLTEVGLDCGSTWLAGLSLTLGQIRVYSTLLTSWVNWSGARGCGVMLMKSSRDRPSVCHVDSSGSPGAGCAGAPARKLEAPYPTVAGAAFRGGYSASVD